MASAVGGVAGTANGRLAVLTGVAAEAPLVNLAVRRAVERQAHVFEVNDGVDGFFREDLGRILVDKIVAALDSVVGVPFPVVVLNVGEGSSHAALRCASVGARRVQLGDHRGACVRSGFNCRAHPGTARADNNDVELVVVNAVFHGRSCVGHLRHRAEAGQKVDRGACRAGVEGVDHKSSKG